MVDGLGGFGQLLARFRASSAWATAGLAAVPFASALAGPSPPWPPGIVALTAVVQLLLLALAYLACLGWSRRRTPALGQASGRGRVCRYVLIPGLHRSYKKHQQK